MGFDGVANMMMYAVTEIDLIGILDAIVGRITGSAGGFVMLVIAVYFVWRLFREAQKDLHTSEARVDRLTEAVEGLTDELRAKRRS